MKQPSTAQANLAMGSEPQTMTKRAADITVTRRSPHAPGAERKRDPNRGRSLSQ